MRAALKVGRRIRDQSCECAFAGWDDHGLGQRSSNAWTLVVGIPCTARVNWRERLVLPQTTALYSASVPSNETYPFALGKNERAIPSRISLAGI